jgi:lipopolysaccharide transport system permease protein
MGPATLGEQMSTQAPSLPGARAAPPRIVIEPSQGWRSLKLGELWMYRELIGFLVWRDLKVRYRQTMFGVLWAVLQPLALMAIFSLFLGQFLKVDTGDIPYPVFAFSALVPWTLFSQSMTAASSSLVANANLLGKIYFPRLVLPVSSVGSYVFDFVISTVLLFGLMAVYGVTPSPAAVLIPVLAFLVLLTALGTGTLLSAINVRYRDVQSGIPLLIQVWLFASPIAYPGTLVPEAWRAVYAINPMVSAIEGFRWALLGTAGPSLAQILVSSASAGFITLLGVFYFRRTERSFADII